jgi:hypothetical protein
VASYINLIKLSVGTESVEDLLTWQNSRRDASGDPHPRHVTRMWPKREDELVNGGSIYWVIKGVVQARQKILKLEEVTRADGIRRCALVFDPEIIRVENALKRPFQGWRYLKPEEAPSDLAKARSSEDALPPKLSAALAEIGVR